MTTQATQDNAAARELGPTPLKASLLRSSHGFFTREGGVSRGLYASLNCGFGAVDDASAAVAENRRRVAARLDTDPTRLVTAYQHHSPDVVVVDAPWRPGDAPRADALVSAVPGIALGVLTADCAPVLFEDAAAGVVGAAHAGWRGAIGGVVEATVAAMVGRGAARVRIRAAIGPCIGPNAYEVGPEFKERFVDGDPTHGRFFMPPATDAAAAAGKARFNLPAYVFDALLAAGVADAVWVGRCTYEEPAHFFSNRRAAHAGEPDYGRLISVIVAADPHDTARLQ